MKPNQTFINSLKYEYIPQTPGTFSSIGLHGGSRVFWYEGSSTMYDLVLPSEYGLTMSGSLRGIQFFTTFAPRGFNLNHGGGITIYAKFTTDSTLTAAGTDLSTFDIVGTITSVAAGTSNEANIYYFWNDPIFPITPTYWDISYNLVYAIKIITPYDCVYNYTTLKWSDGYPGITHSNYTTIKYNDTTSDRHTIGVAGQLKGAGPNNAMYMFT